MLVKLAVVYSTQAQSDKVVCIFLGLGGVRNGGVVLANRLCVKVCIYCFGSDLLKNIYYFAIVLNCITDYFK